MKIKEVTDYLEERFPIFLQEDFDNCGVQCGDIQQEITGAMVCFEMSDEVIDEAISKNCNLVISHHPLILRRGICKIEPKDRVGKMLCKVLAHNMVLYSMHTNADSGEGGGNDKLAEILELKNVSVLAPHSGQFKKLAVFVPESCAENLKNALFNIGCGKLGNYEQCSYDTEGVGQFLPQENANPAIGNVGKLEKTREIKVEVVFPARLQHLVIQTVYENHCYEEPAFDIFTLDNPSRTVGLGRIGKLPRKMPVAEFLEFVKTKLQLEHFRYCGNEAATIETVAVCGGGGANFIDLAIARRADAYISGDFKYHDFFKSDSRILLVDAGHYESEYFIKNIIFDILNEKFHNFAISMSSVEKLKLKYF